MKQICDALVVGSGIIGAATAYALTRAGMKRVSLIEKGPLVSGMTRRSPGLAHPFQAHPTLVELAAESHTVFAQWGMLFGNSKSGFVETGAAVIADTDEIGSSVQAIYGMVSPRVTSVNQTEGRALATLYPGVTTSHTPTLFTPEAGYADASLTALAMLNAAKERGLQVQTGTQVKQILTDRTVVRGVSTTTGEIETPAVIIAAGGWSDRLLAPLGVGLHLRFRRGIVVFYEQPGELTQGHPIFVDASLAHFLRPHPYRMSAAGTLLGDLQSGGVERVDELVAPYEIARTTAFAASAIPAFADAIPKRSHAVLYGSAADGLPVLGRTPNVNGLYLATGFGSSAFAVAPAVGQALAQILLDGNTARDLSAFDPHRHGLMMQL